MPDQIQSMAGRTGGRLVGCTTCLVAALVTMTMLMLMMLLVLHGGQNNPFPQPSKGQTRVGAPCQMQASEEGRGRKKSSQVTQARISQPFVQRPAVVTKYRVQCNIQPSDIGCGG